MKPIFALIGCGRIAERHAKQIARTGILKAVADIVFEKAEVLGNLYNATPYASIEALLQAEPAVEIICICTPNGLHAIHAIKALEAGKNVLCEKPLSISTSDALEILDTSERLHKRLFVVKQNRYNPPVVAVKKLLSEEKLGNILSFQINCFWNRPAKYYENSWKGSLKLDGGTLYTQFSHFIDLLYWFLGDVKVVDSVVKNQFHPAIEIDDSGVAILEMQNGAIGTLNYTVNAYQKNMEGSFTLIGEKGTVKIGGQYLNTLEYQSMEGEEISIQPSGNANDYGYYQGSMSNHDKVYDHLLLALQNPNYEFATVLDGLKTVDIIEKIYENARLK